MVGGLEAGKMENPEISKSAFCLVAYIPVIEAGGSRQLT